MSLAEHYQSAPERHEGEWKALSMKGYGQRECLRRAPESSPGEVENVLKLLE